MNETVPYKLIWKCKRQDTKQYIYDAIVLICLSYVCAWKDSQESVFDKNEVKRLYTFILCHIILLNLVFSFMVYNENLFKYI